MRSKLLTMEEILTILPGSPQRIAALVGGLAPAQLLAPPEPGEWSINDVLAHLRACNDVWGGNMMAIITQDQPLIKGVNPRAWIKKTDYPEQEFQSSLQAFTAQRTELFAVLAALPPEGWSRTGIVIDMVGKRLERTVLSYAEHLARHEQRHVKQIERIVNAMRM